ncbi:MAG TPA: TROVE domain-containing protein, partial [Micromonosporaceae bacterium]
QRADEPGEMLAYWTSRYGRALPKPIKRGVSDAVARLYNERAMLKYDTASHSFRFADVLDLVHAAPHADKPWQHDLFKTALDRRHGRGGGLPDTLPMLRNNATLRAAAAERPDVLLSADLGGTGMTWEDALSLAGSSVDKARLWSAMIPRMGLMALARNLRNFDEAGVPDEVAATVAARFADADQVKRSRMFPFRWLAAYRHARSLRWGYALEQALTASLVNVPALSGRTLILVDMSGSMWSPAGGAMSGMQRCDVAAVFGAALAKRAESATLVSFGSGSRVVPVPAGGSLLKLVEAATSQMGGTHTVGALLQHYAGHDRVVIVTDEQAMSWGHGAPTVDQSQVSNAVPAHVPLYTWNLAGYRFGHAPSSVGARHTFGGLTDAGFRMIPLLEAGRNGAWPWETAA